MRNLQGARYGKKYAASFQFAAAFMLSLAIFLLFFSPLYAADGDGGIKNPLKDEFSTVPGFIAAALQAMVMISLPVLTLFIVYSGFLFVSARGNSSQLETAKKNFMYVIIGAILILGAWVIATLIGGTVKQLIEPAPSDAPVFDTY